MIGIHLGSEGFVVDELFKKEVIAAIDRCYTRHKIRNKMCDLESFDKDKDFRKCPRSGYLVMFRY